MEAALAGITLAHQITGYRCSTAHGHLSAPMVSSDTAHDASRCRCSGFLTPFPLVSSSLWSSNTSNCCFQAFIFCLCFLFKASYRCADRAYCCTGRAYASEVRATQGVWLDSGISATWRQTGYDAFNDHEIGRTSNSLCRKTPILSWRFSTIVNAFSMRSCILHKRSILVSFSIDPFMCAEKLALEPVEMV